MEDIRYRYKGTHEINVTIPRGLGENMYRLYEEWRGAISGIGIGIGRAAKNATSGYRVVIVRRTDSGV